MARKPRDQVVLQSYASIPIHLLEPHPDNPHKGDTDVIAESIDANGFYGAVIAQASTKRIIAGHHRVLAAKKQGLKEIPVLLLDVDDDQAKRIMLADNRTAEFGGYDDTALAAVLSSLPDLQGTGWTADDFSDLDAALAIDTALLEEPLAPARPREAAPTREPLGDQADEAEDFDDAGGWAEDRPDEDDDGEGHVELAPRPYAVVVTCDSQEQRDELAVKLTEDGWNVRVLG